MAAALIAALPALAQTGAQRDAVSSKGKPPVRPDVVRPAAPVQPAPAVPKAPVAAVPEGQLQVISPATALYERGELLFRQQSYAAALSEYTDLVKRFPNSPRREEALYRVAECYRLLGREKDAQAAYAYFLQAYPRSLLADNARLRLGNYAYKAGQFDQAVSVLRPLLEGESKAEASLLAAARYLYGLSLLQEGQTAKGRTELEALMKNPEAKLYWPAVAQALAQSYEQSGDRQQALDAWKRTFSLAKDGNVQAMAAARAGWLALQMEQVPDAERYFGRARLLASSGEWRTAANSGLFRIYSQAERHGDLLKLAESEEGKFLESMRPDVLYGVPAARYALGEYGAADQGFQEFLRAYPQHPIAPYAGYQRLVARSQVAPEDLLEDTQAYLTAYPRAPYQPLVFYLRAQALTRAQRYPEAEKIWRDLQGVTGELADKLPADEIQFELARALYEQEKWGAAADAYLKYIADYPESEQLLLARMRAALAFQNNQRPREALRQWELVLTAAPPESEARQSALEQVGLLSQQTGDTKRAVEAFGRLLQEYPQTEIAAIAQFVLGDDAFARRDFAAAEPALLAARKLDAESHYLLATERLALLSFTQEKPEATRRYRAEYDAAAAKDPAAGPLPAALYFWLGRQAAADEQFARAAEYFQLVAAHPEPGDFAVPVWWELAEAQRREGRYAASVESYRRYRQAKPDLADATEVLLALAQAQLGAAAPDDALPLVEKAMVQTPEGEQNARARALLGDIYLARGDFSQAAKVYSTLSLLYEDPQITPRALERAGEAYQRAGQAEKASQAREELRRRYPDYR
ncbi:MAG: tetratricopeptide repeat protein [Verrucomicrobiota bacterium]